MDYIKEEITSAFERHIAEHHNADFDACKDLRCKGAYVLEQGRNMQSEFAARDATIAELRGELKAVRLDYKLAVGKAGDRVRVANDERDQAQADARAVAQASEALAQRFAVWIQKQDETLSLSTALAFGSEYEAWENALTKHGAQYLTEPHGAGEVGHD